MSCRIIPKKIKEFKLILLEEEIEEFGIEVT